MGFFGKKASKKFGSSTTLVTPEGFTQGSISWQQLSLAAIDTAADGWFEGYKLLPITKSLRSGALDADEHVKDYVSDFAFFLTGENEPMTIPRLEIDLSDLGEQIDLTEGALGPAITSALNNAGVAWRYETLFPIGHAQSVEFPDDKTLGVSQWQTFFGMPLEQTFRVYRNAAGKETCFWSSKVLAATRPFEHLSVREINDEEEDVTYTAAITPDAISKGALTFGEWSTKLFIPAVAKKLFYLAETPFPSNVLMSFGRNIAFGEDLAEERYPRPAIVNSPQTHAKAAFEEDPQGGYLASGTIMPHIVEMGWTFDTTDEAEILKILEVVTSGLTRINSILEDGFLNYRTDDHPYSYDEVLLSASKFDASYVQGKNALGLSYWVPVVRLGILLNETNLRAYEAVREHNVDLQLWMATDGAGMYVPSAINSLVFSTLIQAEAWYTIDRLLDASARMNVKDESTNSLSNWGIAKYKQGLVDEAIEKFDEALARPDKFAEAEASYWLAEIWQQRGDSAKSLTYRSRCEAAGGYNPGPDLAPDGDISADRALLGTGVGMSSGGSTGLSKTSAGGLGEPAQAPAPSGNLAVFCGQCGTKFESDAAKFCSSCGTGR